MTNIQIIRLTKIVSYRASSYTSIGSMIYGLFHLAIYIFSFFDDVKLPSN